MDKILSKICPDCGFKTERIKKVKCESCGKRLVNHEVIRIRPIYG